MEGDTSVSGWFVMALKSAKVAGLHVNHASFDGAIKYLDSVEHKGTGGDPGYAPASTYWYTAVKDAHAPHHRDGDRLSVPPVPGWKKDDLQASVEGFVAKGGVPSWGGNGASVDLYYWYYGTLCVFQQGGDLWKSWNESMKTALTKSAQRRRRRRQLGSVGAYADRMGPRRPDRARLPCAWKCTTAISSWPQINNNLAQ